MPSNIQLVPDEQVLGDLVLDDDEEVFRLEKNLCYLAATRLGIYGHRHGIYG
ncbi:Hypothetical predicted protein, partial [Paramuricea clavata]